MGGSVKEHPSELLFPPRVAGLRVQGEPGPADPAAAAVRLGRCPPHVSRQLPLHHPQVGQLSKLM